MSSDDVNSPEDGSSEKEEKDKKSLVFLTPLCETLVKLKEVIDETADADGIEVFEVEELEEMRHLLPSLGQCLMIASNPRKCAQALLMNKRAIKILQTKSILLSAKKIPNKTLDKFVKVGLTECIVEPVAPKTLLYKVRLLLRSIANRKKGGEFQKKFSEGGPGEAEEAIETTLKGKVGQSGEEEPEQEIKDTKEAEVLGGPLGKDRESSYEEQEIDGHLKGKVNKQEEGDGPDEAQNETGEGQVDQLDSHYKGDIDLDKIDEENSEENMVGESNYKEDVDEDMIADLKKEMAEDLGGHYKADIEKQMEEFKDEIHKNKKSIEIEVEEEEEELKTVDKEILPEHMTGKVGKKLDIEVEEEEEELRDVDKEILPEHMTGKVGKKLEVEVEDEEEELKDKLEDHQAENLVDRKQRKADEIEKYLKSKNLHKSNDEISDLDDIHKKEKQVSLEVEEEEKEREGHSEDLGTKADRLKKGATLDIEEEPDELKEGSGKGDESDGHMRSKKLSAVEEEEKKKRKRVNARADKIETHYSSKKGIKHGDQNWDGLAQEADWDEQPEEKLEEFEKELIYEQKDLGEQTIDYKKIKADFDTIKYEKLDDKIKIVETEDGPVKKKTRFVKKKVINSLWEDEDILFEELIEDDEDEYIPPVFEPNSCGLEFAIEALNMCYDDQLEDVDFFKYIAETVLNEKDGLSAFYFYESKSKMFYDGYIGHLELETDDPDDEKEEAWEELSEENLAKWQESTLPVWKDATFQEEENEFIYPFFEGQNNMGFAVVHFENQISQDDAKFIEVLLESARGIYLTNSHAAGGKGVYGEKKKKETAKLSKGLMGSLFGRKAG